MRSPDTASQALPAQSKGMRGDQPSVHQVARLVVKSVGSPQEVSWAGTAIGHTANQSQAASALASATHPAAGHGFRSRSARRQRAPGVKEGFRQFSDAQP